jgi:predicted RNase H-like HicB family nuclease
MVFLVTLSKAEDGWIVAECPALPGCMSQGKDEQEALANIKEAIAAGLSAEDQKAAAKSRQLNQREILVTA